VVFIHGVLNDHSVWILQSRYFAHHGWNVLAIDLPGHGRSGARRPPASKKPQTVLALLDAVGAPSAALVGHSWGSLIALEAAARAPDRVSHLVLCGTAFPMKVSPALLDNALNAPEKAIHMVNVSRAARSARRPRPWAGHLAVRRQPRADAPRAGQQPRVNVFTPASRPATAMPAASRRWRRCNARRCSSSARTTR
jgi:pimeloyl-ACP methyl ester carboxylesterase